MSAFEKLPVEYAPGDYAIVELFGHTTLVGRIEEVERFGTKMLALEPLFRGVMLPAVFHAGTAIYRLTPCTAETAWAHQASERYHLPPSIIAIVPPILLSSSQALQGSAEQVGKDFGEVDAAPDSIPF